MSQNPYSASGMQPGSPIENFAQGFEPRTSVMAIVSLVLGILSLVMCCVGLGAIAGVPAAGFGIAAIIAINGKQGALSGRGMAVSGIVTGTIGLFGTILVWVGVSTSINGMAMMYRPVMSGIESADVRAVQNVLTVEASAQLDEAKLLAFRKEYQDRLGAYQGMDANAIKFIRTAIKTYSDPGVQQLMQKEKRVPMVMDAKFANGDAQIWLIMRENTTAKGNTKIFVDIRIVPPTGNPISLMGLGSGTTTTPPANPDPNATPPAAPSAPSAPAPEQPATPPTGG